MPSCAEIYRVILQGFYIWHLLSQDEPNGLDRLGVGRYGPVLKAIAGRAISKAKDEAFYLSLFLKLPHLQMLDSCQGEEMITFWNLQDKVPEDVLFSRCSKLDVNDLRWAPSSVLDWSTQAASVHGPLEIGAKKDSLSHSKAISLNLWGCSKLALLQDMSSARKRPLCWSDRTR